MDIKDVANDLYASMLDTHKSFMELARICKKSIVQQNNINKRFFVIACVGVAFVVATEIHRKEQDERIDKLCKELEDLKKEKGE